MIKPERTTRPSPIASQRAAPSSPWARRLHKLRVAATTPRTSPAGTMTIAPIPTASVKIDRASPPSRGTMAQLPRLSACLEPSGQSATTAPGVCTPDKNCHESTISALMCVWSLNHRTARINGPTRSATATTRMCANTYAPADARNASIQNTFSQPLLAEGGAATCGPRAWHTRAPPGCDKQRDTSVRARHSSRLAQSTDPQTGRTPRPPGVPRRLLPLLRAALARCAGRGRRRAPRAHDRRREPCGDPVLALLHRRPLDGLRACARATPGGHRVALCLVDALRGRHLPAHGPVGGEDAVDAGPPGVRGHHARLPVDRRIRVRPPP